MAADSVLQSSVDDYIGEEQVSERQISDVDNSNEPDFHVQDHTDRTNSIVITVSDSDIYDTVKNYLTSNLSHNILKSCDGIIYKTLHQSLNVIVTAYNCTKRFHMQGKGCKSWWDNIFIFIVKDIIKETKAQWPFTSTPSPCCASNMTELKQITTKETCVINTSETELKDIGVADRCENSMTELKQIAATESYANQSTMEPEQMNNNSIHQLSSCCCTMQSKLDMLEESNKSYRLQITSNAEALNRAKNKLRLFSNTTDNSLTNHSIKINSDLKEENNLLKEQIDNMRETISSNRSEIKLLAQDRKYLTESLRQANEQCEEQIELLSALMDQSKQTNKPKVQQQKKKCYKKSERPINSTSTINHFCKTMSQTPDQNPETPKTFDTEANSKSTMDVYPDYRRNADNQTTSRSGRTLLIGSSILKLVNQRGLSGDVNVMCIRGGIIPDIGTALLNMDISTYETIVIHVGGNDASQGECISDIICEYERLLNVVFSQNPDINVVVSELTPRKDVDVRSLNIALKSFCIQRCLPFVENYATTECQPRYIHRDGIHLTKM